MKKSVFGIMLAGLFASPLVQAVEFQSPSGNIGCASYGKVLRCDIGSPTRPALAKPKDCAYLEWGNAFELSATGKARMICYSDTVLGVGEVLPYGQSINGNGWTCTSQTSGMRCVNRSGHGFNLSRAKQTLF